jgi:predicted P-loop ATPase/GTPase
MERYHLPAVDAVGEDIAAVDRAVVESYGDVARPLQDLGPDAVAVVEPTRVRVVDGDRYRKGCAVAAGGPREGQLEEHVGDVMDLVDPVTTVDLPALSGEERSDPETVARAYGAAYDELLAAAGW